VKDNPIFEDVPEFAPSGAKLRPSTAKYSGGYVSKELFPFDHANWLFNGITKNGVTEQDYIGSIQAELKSILTAHGVTPNPELTNQLAGVFSRYVFGDNARATVSITDANAPVKSGFYSLATPYTNGPTAAAYYIIHLQQSGSDNFAMQIASLSTGNNSWVRTKNNGTWSSWAKLWNSDNDGIGSGLDAGLLAGIDPVNGSLGISTGYWSFSYPDPFVPPKGLYMITPSGPNISLEIWAAGTEWHMSSTSLGAGLFLFDGTNYRFRVLTSVSTSVAYRKLA